MKDFTDASIETLLTTRGGVAAVELKPERVNTLLFSKDKSDVQRIFNALDDEGKELAQRAVLVNMAQDATTDLVNLSPNQFANLVGRRANTLGVVLSEENHQMMKGLKQYLDITRAAEDMVAVGPWESLPGRSNFPG